MTDNIEEASNDEGNDSDYDGAWKEAFRSHLPDFLDRFFPKFAKLINWAEEPKWYDKEISQILGQTGQRNREVDLLFNVRLLDGKEQWILCHLEIQTSYQVDFAFRLDLYNSGLKWHFRQDVLTLVVLADLNPQWRPDRYRFELGGFESYRQFPICKVRDFLDGEWAEDYSLVIQVARAQIAALQTASDPNARYNAKIQLVRNLYQVGYTAHELRELFRLIDWMMQLPRELSRMFNVELIAYEKELQVPYLTSIERNAEERGMEKGREEGGAVLVLRQLVRPCGALPADVEQKVRSLQFEQIQALGEALFDFKSLADLRKWLEAVNQ